MSRLKRYRDTHLDNFHWLKFSLRVVLIFVFTFSGSLYALIYADRKMDGFDLLISLVAAVFVSAWCAESFIANPKKLNWDYGRLRPSLLSLPDSGAKEGNENVPQ